MKLLTRSKYYQNQQTDIGDGRTFLQGLEQTMVNQPKPIMRLYFIQTRVNSHVDITF